MSLLKVCNSETSTINKKFTNTSGTDTVTDLCGDVCGTVSVRSDVKPIIKKTNNEKLPFKLANNVSFKVVYKDNNKNKIIYKIPVKKGYKWDGASIPSCFQWLAGKNNEPEYAVASMVHDVMCQKHSVIGHDRRLSSNVFKTLLKQNGTPSFGANIMSWCVDAYQYLFSNWKSPIRKYVKAVA